MTKTIIQKSWIGPRTALSRILAISACGVKSEDGLILQMPFPQLQHLTFPNETEIPMQLDREGVFPPLNCFKTIPWLWKILSKQQAGQ